MSFGSELCFLELVQDVSESIGRMVGFDEDGRYWVSLSVRESVTNAIMHGNNEDAAKKVGVRFTISNDRLIIRVQDEGGGFDEGRLPDPLDPSNVLKSSGRGIFYVRSFMDDVRYRRLPEGGWEMRMEKKLNHTQGDSNDH
jgi:serine/threonine-protein kinase RsbW